MSLANIMQIGLTGMFAASASMQTSGHNIANAGTPGFSRQRTVTGSALGISSAYGVLGSGTQIVSINRQTDNFLVSQMRDQSSLLAQYDSESSALLSVEAIFGSVGNNHLGESMEAFFSAWSNLSSPPNNEILVQDVLGTAEILVMDLNAMDNSLMDLASDLDDQIAAGVSNMNQLLDSVAEYNRLIIMGESGDSSANDLRDQRDAVLSAISELANVETVERSDGTVDVILSGRTLVSRDNVEHLEVRYEEADGFEPGCAKVTVKNGRYDVTMSEGALSGLITARDDYVLGTREKLDKLTATLIEKVNALHVQGVSEGGSGLLFFTGSSASDIAVNRRIVDNPTYLATSRSNLSGDADIAGEIAALGQSTSDVDGGLSMTELFTALVVDLASETAGAEFRVEGQQELVESLDVRLESVRGVSLDEEAANIALYQNAYQANARVISAVQEMFESVLTMV